MTVIFVKQDFEVRRGGNVPAVCWIVEGEDGAPLKFDGRYFILTIRHRGETIRKDTRNGDGLVADPAASSITWTPTLEESRRIPKGRLSEFEVELRENGTQLPIVGGFVVGVGGLNDD